MAKKGQPAKRAARATSRKAAPSETDRLLQAIEHLDVEALRQVIDRATNALDEKTGSKPRSFMGDVAGRAMGLGSSIAGLVGRVVPDALLPAGKKRPGEPTDKPLALPQRGRKRAI
jgi:hypothetical protein